MNNPRSMTCIRITKGTKEIRTTTTNSSVNIFLKSQKLRDKSFEKFSNMLIGRRIGINWLDVFIKIS